MTPTETWQAAMATIAEALGVEEVATPGPWEPYVLGSEGYDLRSENPANPRRRLRVARFGYEDWDTDKANAEAASLARVVLRPALLAAQVVLGVHRPDEDDGWWCRGCEYEETWDCCVAALSTLAVVDAAREALA